MSNDPGPVATLTSVDRYHILRGQIQHEDNLTTQRLSWLMAAQSFLFSAYAIVMNGPATPMSAFVRAQRDWLITAIPALAFTTATLIYVSILAGVAALSNLHRHAEGVCATQAYGHFPPIQGTLRTRMYGLVSPMLVPPLFMSVWLWLMLRGMTR